MALVRPSRKQSLEQDQELGLVEQVLSELQVLNGKVDGLVNAQELMKMNLLGGVDEDSEHGRLPRVEATVRNHEGRIAVIEADRIRWRAYAAAAAGIGGIAGSLIGIGISVISAVVRHS